MSLSKHKCWYSNNCLDFLKCTHPLRTTSGDKKFILCLTDTFTKYVELVTIPNKGAFTVATAILNRWICHFGEYHSAECHSAECHCAECHSAECHSAECHSAECHYAKCHSAECHYAKCHSAKCHSAECHSAE